METTVLSEVLRGNSNCFDFDLKDSCICYHPVGEFTSTSKGDSFTPVVV